MKEIIEQYNNQYTPKHAMAQFGSYIHGINNYSMKISIESLLLILFITLKLTHVINWSWIWVLSPIWIPSLIILTLSLIIKK